MYFQAYLLCTNNDYYYNFVCFVLFCFVMIHPIHLNIPYLTGLSFCVYWVGLAKLFLGDISLLHIALSSPRCLYLIVRSTGVLHHRLRCQSWRKCHNFISHTPDTHFILSEDNNEHCSPFHFLDNAILLCDHFVHHCICVFFLVLLQIVWIELMYIIVYI